MNKTFEEYCDWCNSLIPNPNFIHTTFEEYCEWLNVEKTPAEWAAINKQTNPPLGETINPPGSHSVISYIPDSCTHK